MDTVNFCTNCNYWYNEEDGKEVVTHKSTMVDPEEKIYITPCCKQNETKVVKQFETLEKLLDELNRREK